MAPFSKFTKSWFFITTVAVLWYANLFILILALTDFFGSDTFRDYKLLIAVIFAALSGVLWKLYTIRKRDQIPGSEE